MHCTSMKVGLTYCSFLEQGNIICTLFIILLYYAEKYFVVFVIGLKQPKSSLIFNVQVRRLVYIGCHRKA